MNSGQKSNELPIYIISTILITLTLGFIDEGYYNFKWMADIGNWIALLVYAFAIFMGQLIFSFFILKKLRRPLKVVLSIIGGATVGIFFIALLIFRTF